jgi:hypothetical protein
MAAGFVEVVEKEETLVAGCRELVHRKEQLIAEAYNHPNLLVLPFRLELIRVAA